MFGNSRDEVIGAREMRRDGVIQYGDDEILLDPTSASKVRDIANKIAQEVEGEQKSLLAKKKDIFGLAHSLNKLVVEYKINLEQFEVLSAKEREFKTLSEKVTGNGGVITSGTKDVDDLGRKVQELGVIHKKIMLIKDKIRIDKKKIENIISLLVKKVDELIKINEVEKDKLENYKIWLTNDATEHFDNVSEKFETGGTI